MKIISTRFFKLREPKKFRYIPRYYDPRKKEIDYLTKKYARESKSDEEGQEKIRRELAFRSQMNNRWSRQRTSAADLKSRNVRLLFSLLLVLGLTFWAMKKYGIWELFF